MQEYLNGKDTTDEKYFKNYWNLENELKSEGLETIKELFERINDFLNDIKAKYEDKNILVVTHNGVCRAFEVLFNGEPKSKDIRNLGYDNCQIKMYNL